MYGNSDYLSVTIQVNRINVTNKSIIYFIEIVLNKKNNPENRHKYSRKPALEFTGIGTSVHENRH